MNKAGLTRVSVKLNTRVVSFRQGKVWVAGAPNFDVFSQGGTREKAVAHLREALDLWFESCLSRGTLDGALRELGFHLGDALAPSTEVIVEIDKELNIQHQKELSFRNLTIEIPAFAKGSAFVERQPPTS